MSRVEKEEHKNTRRNFVAPIIVSTRWGLSGSKLKNKSATIKEHLDCPEETGPHLRKTLSEKTLHPNPLTMVRVEGQQESEIWVAVVAREPPGSFALIQRMK